MKGKSCGSEYIGNPANRTVNGKPAVVKYLGNPVAKMYIHGKPCGNEENGKSVVLK